MMEEIIAILSSLILGTPGWVMMPLVLLFIGKAFGLSWGKALKHGLLWGIGIWGLTTILGTIAPQLITPVLQMSTRLGLSKNILDTWAVWNSMWVISLWPILAIGLGLAWNVVLLLIGITKTFDVDIWNYHFIAVIAMYTEFLTGSFYIAIGAFLIFFTLTVLLGDWQAPVVQKHFDLPETISFPHLQSVWAYVFAEVLDPVYNSIPGLKDWKADPKTIREKLGMLGDPVMISFLLFFAVGLLAYFPDVMTALQMAVLAGAMLYIMPKMTTIIMEGITPIADAIKTKTAKSKRFKNIYIGVDSYILAGYEDVISSSMFAMVILALLCLVVPWINIIPLMTLPWLVGDTNMICARHKGNVIRATITTVIFYLVGIVIAQMAAPLYTQVVAAHMSALFPVTPGTLQICAGPYRTWMYLWQFLLQGIGLVNI